MVVLLARVCLIMLIDNEVAFAHQRVHTSDLMLKVAEEALLHGDISFRDSLIIRRQSTWMYFCFSHGVCKNV